MTTLLNGIVPPVLTPMDDEGNLDLASLDAIVDHLIEHGCTALFVLGSSGQVAYLTDEQRDIVIGRVVERAAGRVPVLAGTPDMIGARVAEQAKRAEKLGAAAVVVTAPLYALNNEAEIAEHFRMVAAAVSIPVIAYDVPVRVRTKLSVGLLMQLAAEGVIKGVKDSSGDDVSFRQLILANRAAGSPLEIATGHEVVVDGALLSGADAVVPGLGNVDPAGYVRLFNAAKAGDWETARTEQDRLVKLMSIVGVPQGRSGDATGIGAFKAAMFELGLIESAGMPKPMTGLTPAEHEGIAKILVEVGLKSA